MRNTNFRVMVTGRISFPSSLSKLISSLSRRHARFALSSKVQIRRRCLSLQSPNSPNTYCKTLRLGNGQPPFEFSGAPCEVSVQSSFWKIYLASWSRLLEGKRFMRANSSTNGENPPCILPIHDVLCVVSPADEAGKYKTRTVAQHEAVAEQQRLKVLRLAWGGTYTNPNPPVR